MFSSLQDFQNSFDQACEQNIHEPGVLDYWKKGTIIINQQYEFLDFQSCSSTPVTRPWAQSFSVMHKLQDQTWAYSSLNQLTDSSDCIKMQVQPLTFGDTVCGPQDTCTLQSLEPYNTARIQDSDHHGIVEFMDYGCFSSFAPICDSSSSTLSLLESYEIKKYKRKLEKATLDFGARKRQCIREPKKDCSISGIFNANKVLINNLCVLRLLRGSCDPEEQELEYAKTLKDNLAVLLETISLDLNVTNLLEMLRFSGPVPCYRGTLPVSRPFACYWAWAPDKLFPCSRTTFRTPHNQSKNAVSGIAASATQLAVNNPSLHAALMPSESVAKAIAQVSRKPEKEKRQQFIYKPLLYRQQMYRMPKDKLYYSKLMQPYSYLQPSMLMSSSYPMPITNMSYFYVDKE